MLGLLVTLPEKSVPRSFPPRMHCGRGVLWRQAECGDKPDAPRVRVSWRRANEGLVFETEPEGAQQADTTAIREVLLL